ncbi:MAG: hypothetical protein ACON42_05780 [Flavobacteriaceae bacterium]
MFRKIILPVLGAFLLLQCSDTAESPTLDIDPQLIGKWKIRRPNTSKTTDVCYVNQIVIGEQSVQVQFISAKNGVQRNHEYLGAYRMENGNLVLPEIMQMNNVQLIQGQLYFEFVYDPELEFFCSWVNWQEEHLHDPFGAIGER